MHTIKLKSMKRSGLFAEHAAIRPATHYGVRLTIPTLEALESSGAEIVRRHDGRYDVTPGADVMPDGIVAVVVVGRPEDGGGLALRMENEPEYPGELTDWAYWQQLDFTPCPSCGAPLVWYEAGYVPGYRVCSRSPHHHYQALGYVNA